MAEEHHLGAVECNLTTKQYVPVFLSSTYLDLKPYRKAVWDELEALKMSVNGMEIFGARPEQPLETSLAEVSKSRYFICVLGTRYGSVEDNTGKSFTQLEYEKALEEKKQILVYLIDEEGARVAPRFVDKGREAELLSALKEEVGKRHTIDYFQSPEQLASSVKRDLLRLFEEHSVGINKSTLGISEDPSVTLGTLGKFDVMPGRLHGERVELRVRIKGAPEEVPRTECEALRLTCGQAIKRRADIVAPEGISKGWSWADWLYAEGELADKLYEMPDGHEVSVKARLAFGEERDLVVVRSYPAWMHVVYTGDEGVTDLETGSTRRSYSYTEKHTLRALVLSKVLTSMQ
ncbi:MAG: DUF4062 domain-containing protein [Chloroflexi bacterium]|nr:DUF4062 domain-containing protein [Chloroflexota bacterium]